MEICGLCAVPHCGIVMGTVSASALPNSNRPWRGWSLDSHCAAVIRAVQTTPELPESHASIAARRPHAHEIYICAIVAHREVTVDSATVTRDSPSVKINLPSCSAYLLTDT